MDLNEEQKPDMTPMPRLVVKLDSEPKLELQMRQGDTLSVEYHREGDHGGPPPPPVDPLVEEIRTLCIHIEEILEYFDRNGVLKDFVCLRLQKPWKKFKKDTIIALIEYYKWPSHEKEGLQSLLHEAQQFLSEFGAPSKVREERQ